MIRAPKDKLVVLRGLDNYIVIDEGDALMIYPKEKEQDIKTVTEKIWKTFISENRFNTQITFNFHNSRFYDANLEMIPLRTHYEGLFSTEND